MQRKFGYYILGLLIFGSVSAAELHRCVDEAGKITYQDAPCQKAAVSASLLSLQSEDANVKTIKQQEQKFKKTAKQQQNAANKALRLNNQAAKRLSVEADKQARRDLRCQRLDEKYALLESQLRSGAKFKRRQSLETQLEHVRLMQQRYCNRE